MFCVDVKSFIIFMPFKVNVMDVCDCILFAHMREQIAAA